MKIILNNSLSERDKRKVEKFRLKEVVHFRELAQKKGVFVTGSSSNIKYILDKKLPPRIEGNFYKIVVERVYHYSAGIAFVFGQISDLTDQKESEELVTQRWMGNQLIGELTAWIKTKFVHPMQGVQESQRFKYPETLPNGYEWPEEDVSWFLRTKQVQTFFDSFGGSKKKSIRHLCHHDGYGDAYAIQVTLIDSEKLKYFKPAHDPTLISEGEAKITLKEYREFKEEVHTFNLETGDIKLEVKEFISNLRFGIPLPERKVLLGIKLVSQEESEYESTSYPSLGWQGGGPKSNAPRAKTSRTREVKKTYQIISGWEDAFSTDTYDMGTLEKREGGIYFKKIY